MIQQLRQLLLLQKTPLWFPGPISSGLQLQFRAPKTSRLTYLNTHAKKKKLHVHLTKNNPLKII